MTDDPTDRPAPGSDGPDHRDEHLAALLAVPTLDEHTRRRLVRRALDAAPASTRRRPPVRLLGAAAVLLVVAAVTGVLLTRGDGQPGPQASRRAGHPPAGAGPQIPSAAEAPPRDLGGVGDVTSPARLRAVVTGASAPTGASLARIQGACGTRTPGGVTRPDLVGIGADAGRPVGIIVGPDPAGQRTIVVVALDGCTLLERLAPR